MDKLIGRKICLVCGDLVAKKGDNPICTCNCEPPDVIPATFIHQFGLGQLRKMFSGKPKHLRKLGI